MPANSTQQTVQHSGGDSSVSDSQRTSDHRQKTDNRQTNDQKTVRTGLEDRRTEGGRGEETKTQRETGSTNRTERAQTTENKGSQSQTNRDVTLVERPQVVRRTRQTGGGQTQTLREDLAMTVSFELEVMSPLSIDTKS